MTAYRYRVPARAGTAELRERGSRFSARIDRVASEDEAKERLAAIAARHPDASHHCWAWRLGNPPRERSSDAGEPAGTAGAPILRALRGAEISDALGVVTRWFGGTKLGKGGLARAYGGAAREALAGTPVAERFTYEFLELRVPYAAIGEVRRLVHPPEVELVSADYGEEVHCSLRVIPPRRGPVLERLAALGIRAATSTAPPRESARDSGAE